MQGYMTPIIGGVCFETNHKNKILFGYRQSLLSRSRLE
jgi:hypothetical protein